MITEDRGLISYMLDKELTSSAAPMKTDWHILKKGKKHGQPMLK